MSHKGTEMHLSGTLIKCSDCIKKFAGALMHRAIMIICAFLRLKLLIIILLLLPSQADLRAFNRNPRHLWRQANSIHSKLFVNFTSILPLKFHLGYMLILFNHDARD